MLAEVREEPLPRVDGDIIERLIPKEDAKNVELSKEETDKLTESFKSQLPETERQTSMSRYRHSERLPHLSCSRRVSICDA